MDEFIKLLDKNLDYVSHEIIDNTIYIYVISNRNKCTCPYCGQDSSKVHSKYIQNKIIIDSTINNSNINNKLSKYRKNKIPKLDKTK